MKKTKQILFLILPALVLFAGCGGLIPKQTLKVGDKKIVIGYEKVQPEWKCEHKGESSYVDKDKPIVDLRSESTKSKLRFRFYAEEAAKLGANYVDIKTGSTAGAGGFSFKTSSEIGRYYRCTNFPKE